MLPNYGASKLWGQPNEKKTLPFVLEWLNEVRIELLSAFLMHPKDMDPT